MKKLIFVTSFLMVLVLAPMVMADHVQLYQQSLYSYSNGGEFTAHIAQSSGGPDLNLNLNYYSSNTRDIGNYDSSFQTFCLEKSETFNPGVLYNVAISNMAVAGGTDLGNNTSGNDPLSVGVAWLYHEFQLGILSGYDYVPSGRDVSAGALQTMIWFLEDEIASPNWQGSTNPFEAVLFSQFTNYANAKGDNNGAFPVAVLNLSDNAGGLHQDQLVCTPVPEPATMLLLGSGLLGLAGFARKRFKK